MRSQRFHWMLLDVSLAAAALALAYSLRFFPELLAWLKATQTGAPFPYIDPMTGEPQFRIYLKQALLMVPALALLRVLLLHLFGLYRGFSRFAGLHEMRIILLGVTTGTVLLVVWEFLTLLFRDPAVLPGLPAELRVRVPIPVVVVEWMAGSVAAGGPALPQPTHGQSSSPGIVSDGGAGRSPGKGRGTD